MKYNRFILCHNKLSEHIEKKPAKVNTIDETTRIVGGFEYIITTDLTDSFWQRHISQEKLPYMCFHSPYRGTYIFLRSTQGLINQSEGLEEMLSVVLQDCIMSGWCRILADNVYIMGNSYKETVDRWQIVLQLMKANNLKLSAHKTACFPEKLDLLGWTKQGKLLVPDPHRQNRLAVASLPATVEQLRSYRGGYRTYYRCKADMSMILREMEMFVAGKKSSEKLEWSDKLKEKFEESKKKIKHLDDLYLPSPDDQLVTTSDWCEGGISATLWAMPEEDKTPKVVARFSAKLSRTMEKFYKDQDPSPKTCPCDGEMSAVFVAIKSPTFSSHIRASSKRTVSLVDNKPVVQAASLLKNGKFSSSRVINNLMTAISEHNLEFQHISGKLGQNFADDFFSRNPAACAGDPHCKICCFIEDCKTLTVGSLSFSFTKEAIIGHVTQSSTNLVHEVMTGIKSIPFSNRKAMLYLQDRDEDLLKVREYLTTTKRPTVGNTKETKVKRYLKKQNQITISTKDGVLVARKRDRYLNMKELVVVPEDISLGLLYAMHINLSHPTAFQLLKVVDTRFFILDREMKIKKIVEDCTLCLSIAKLPEEIHTFKPNLMPEHPGQAFTIDILRMAKKIIVVSVENFSGFISTAFINSEKQEDLVDGIITTVSPFKSVSLTHIRVDQAPGFRAIFKKPEKLKDMQIDLEMGDCKNKNALALVDKKMQELELEIKKTAPNKNTVNIKILAKATTTVNEKIRHQGLSSKEILFSRDQFTLENLKLSDENLAEDKMKIRDKENVYSAKSRATTSAKATSAQAKKGQLVFLKKEGNKLEKRDLYLVVDNDEAEDSVSVCKLPGALSGDSPIQFQPHNISYKVKQTEIFLAPNQPVVHQPPRMIQKQVLPTYHTPYPSPSHIPPTTTFYAKKKLKYPSEDDDEDYSDDDTESEETESSEQSEERTPSISETADSSDDNEQGENISEGEINGREMQESDENEVEIVPENQQEESVDEEDRGGQNNEEEGDAGFVADDENNSETSELGDKEDSDEEDSDEEDSDEEDSDEEDRVELVANYENNTDVSGERDDQTSEENNINWLDLQFNPIILPEVGDRIIFWDNELNDTVRATVIKMPRKLQEKWPGWRNIKAENSGITSSVNLDLVCENCTVWRYLDMEVEEFNEIPQNDGNYTIAEDVVFTEYDTAYFGDPRFNRRRLIVTIPNDNRVPTPSTEGRASTRPTSPGSPSAWRRHWKHFTELFNRLRRRR